MSRARDESPARASPFLLGLVGLVLLLVFLSWASPNIVYGRFVEPYLWRPIVRDEGYNVVNTAALLVVLFFLGGWIYQLLHRFHVRIDVGLTLAPILLEPAGAIVRVLEDSDLFAPFSQEIHRARPELSGHASCVPEVGGTFLHQCFGALLITPTLYVWLVMLVAAFGRTAFWAEQIQRAQGTPKATQFYSLTLVAMAMLGLAWSASGPDYVRFTVPSWWILASIAAATGAYAILHRRLGRYDWRTGLFTYCLVFLLWVSYYVGVWMTGGRGDWTPATPTQPAFLLVAFLVPAALVGVFVFQVRVLSGRAPRRLASGPAWRAATLLLVGQGFAWFLVAAGMLGLAGALGSTRIGATWALSGVATAALLVGVALLVRRTRGTNAVVALLADPMAFLLVGGQYLDGLMTSIGLDLLHSTEKHVLPRALIGLVQGLSLPGALAAFPTLLVLVPYKLVLCIALVWVLDVRLKAPLARFPNVAPLLKGVAILVGLGPGFRDALRFAMGV